MRDGIIEWDLSLDEVHELAYQLADTIIEVWRDDQYNPYDEVWENIYSMDLEVMVTSVAGVVDPIGQLKGFITDVLNTVASWIVDATTATVKGFIDTLWSSIYSVLSGITKSLSDVASAISKLADMLKEIVIEPVMRAIASAEEFLSQLPSLISEISDAISGVLEQVGKSVEGLVSTIGEWIGKLQDAFSAFLEQASKFAETALGSLAKIGEFASAIVELFSKVQDAVASFVEYLAKLPEVAPELARDIATWVWENLIKPTYDTIKETVIDPLVKWFESIVAEVSKGFETLSVTFQGFVNAITKLPEMFWALVPDWLKGTFEAIGKALEDFVKALEDFLRDPLGWIQENVIKPLSDALAEFSKWIWENLPDWLKGIIIEIQKIFAGIWESIQEFFRNPLGWIQKNIIEPLYNALKGFAEWFWSVLPDWFKSAVTTLYEFLSNIWKGIREFIENPLGWIQKNIIEPLYNALKGFAEWFWSILPDWLKDAITAVGDFFSQVWEALKTFFTEQLPKFLEWIWQTIQEFMKDPLELIAKWLGDLWNKILGVASTIAEALKGAFRWVIETFTEWSWSLVQMIHGVVTAIFESAQKLIETAFREGAKLLEKGYKEYLDLVKKPAEAKVGEIDAFTLVYLPAAGMYTITVSLPSAIEGLAETLQTVALSGEAEGSGEPLGVGVAGRILAQIRAKIGAVLSRIGKALGKIPEELLLAATMTMFFYHFEILRYASRPLWINLLRSMDNKTLGYEIPGTSEIIRIIQRYYPTAYASELFDHAKDTLYFRGYPAWFYDYVVDQAKDIHSKLFGTLTRAVGKNVIVEITDRFGTKRRFPCSEFFDIPTASEMCAMMVRDIFAGLEEFTKAIAMRGFAPDIAYMYYLLHFKYPSPERLWEATCRGISGLFWFTPSDVDVKRAEEEARKIGAKVPVPPTDLNFEYTKLFDALSTYMKWHDYAKFAWIDGFTSDNWLYIDLLADIPTKIDIRWMTKWGLFDFMSAKGIGVKTPVEEFKGIMDDTVKNEKVVMDLQLMCRLLQATGLHPFYVPIVAVAESINALADERTLLRTGIINLYEVGAVDYSTIDKLMAGLLVASFKVAYFDMEKMDWQEKAINIPVMFLPAERKLLELRALIDRFHRVFKDVLRDVETAYREYILEEEDAVNVMKSATSTINKVFKETAKEVVGREIGLVLDENYIKTVLATMSLERYIYTIRRIRYWYARIIAWMLYRLAYAYVRMEDVEKLLDVAKRAAKLSDEEINALKALMSIVVNVAGREYIPTPSQLATIAEIVPEARKLFKEVVIARRVPSEWISIWAKYVARKPIIDELKRVLADVRKLFTHFLISEDQWKDFLKILTRWGWEDYEIKLLKDEANLERWYYAYDHLIGTPKELVTMAEYSPRARALALGQVYKMIDALPVDAQTKDFLKKMWEEYIRIKPVYDEVRREVTELISDYAYGVIDWDMFVSLLEKLKEWGLDDWEIDAYKFIAMMRRKRYELRRQRGYYSSPS